MEDLIRTVCDNAAASQWLLVALILLAGLNVPISIDIILISAGALAATCIPEKMVSLFFLLFAATWVSAWESYWIGRLLGPKLYNIRWFSHILTHDRIERLHYYYEKYGWLTFMAGRFIPGGVRNALFMSSGLGKMPFEKFIIRDLPACFLLVSLEYYLGYLLGANYESIIPYIKKTNAIAAVLFALAIVWMVFYLRRKKSMGKVE